VGLQQHDDRGGVDVRAVPQVDGEPPGAQRDGLADQPPPAFDGVALQRLGDHDGRLGNGVLGHAASSAGTPATVARRCGGRSATV
jgi:hypothetical protein